MKKQVIEILQAIPAAGKTKAILEYAISSKSKVIIASISLQLSKQSYDFFIDSGGEGAAIIDSSHVSSHVSVQETLKNALLDYSVIFVTHKTLIDFPDLDLMKEYELFIDEVPEFVNMQQIKFTDNLEMVTRYCDVNNNIITAKKEHIKKLEQIAKDGITNDDAISAILLPVIKAILQGDIVILRNSTIFFIEDVATRAWHLFKKVTVACANFTQTLTGVILQEFYGWEFKISPLVENLLFTKYPNSDRVEIVVLTNSNWSKSVGQREIDGTLIYNLMTKSVSDLMNKIPFIYTTNSYRPTLQHGTKIAYNPHGLNSYKSFTNAVALFSFNPAPWQNDVLTHLAVSHGLDSSILVDAYIVSRYLEPTFQLCTRTDIRNYNSKHKIKLIVSDLRAAEYLKNRYLPDATINMEFAIDTKITKRKRVEVERIRTTNNTFPGIFNMSDDEKKLFAKWKRVDNLKLKFKNSNDVMKVRDWICKIRT